MGAPQCSIDDLFDLIRDQWPDYVVNKDLFVRPSAENVFEFYSKINSEFSNKIQILINDPTTDEVIPLWSKGGKSDYEHDEFCKFATLMAKLNSTTTFTLTDIYRPVSRRTTLFATVGLHFLMYIDSVYGTAAEILNEMYEFNAKYEQEDGVRNSILKSIEELMLLDDRKKHKWVKHGAQLEDEKKEYSKAFEDDAIKCEYYTQCMEDFKKWVIKQSTCEYKLNSIKEQGEDLQQQIVTTEYVEQLKTNEECLKSQLQNASFSSQCNEEVLANKHSQFEHHEYVMNEMKGFTIDEKLFDTLRAIDTEQKALSDSGKEREQQLVELAVYNDDLDNEINDLRLKYEMDLNVFEDVQNTMNANDLKMNETFKSIENSSVKTNELYNNLQEKNKILLENIKEQEIQIKEFKESTVSNYNTFNMSEMDTFKYLANYLSTTIKALNEKKGIP